MSTFPLIHPHAHALGLRVIDAGPGYDELEVEAALGPVRFASLMQGVKQVFVCGHASYPAECFKGDVNKPENAPTHRIAGYEIHCIYARDLEAFLSQEGK